MVGEAARGVFSRSLCEEEMEEETALCREETGRRFKGWLPAGAIW